MDKDKVQISIPKEIYQKIEEEIKKSDVNSVEEYVVKMLIEKFPGESDENFSEEDEEKVKERLKALGYID
ncbi:MAG: CopG family transcriptional regulator [Candidatus Aminicenantes bacterium]|nr:CopG family transcriptional regulator [Candidatus Aminicenantes bacterium]